MCVSKLGPTSSARSADLSLIIPLWVANEAARDFRRFPHASSHASRFVGAVTASSRLLSSLTST